MRMAGKRVKSEAWTYVAGWLKTEPFWQGVAASTFSTGLMALAGLVAALMTGWIDFKSAAVAVVSFLLVLSVAGLILVPRLPWKELTARRKAMDKDSSSVQPQVMVPLGAAAIFALVALAFINGVTG